MEIRYDFTNGTFRTEKSVLNKIMPFSHVEAVIDCIEPVCCPPDSLQNEFVNYLGKELCQLGLNPKWDKQEVIVQQQPISSSKYPFIKKLKFGINVDLIV
jgi:hypothetical protein